MCAVCALRYCLYRWVLGSGLEWAVEPWLLASSRSSSRAASTEGSGGNRSDGGRGRDSTRASGTRAWRFSPVAQEGDGMIPPGSIRRNGLSFEASCRRWRGRAKDDPGQLRTLRLMPACWECLRGWSRRATWLEGRPDPNAVLSWQVRSMTALGELKRTGDGTPEVSANISGATCWAGQTALSTHHGRVRVA